MTFVCVAVAALACTGTLRLIGIFEPVALQHDTAYIGAMLFVIPGFPLITGGLDMAKIDFPSGIQRVAYVLCIILMATLAGWMVASIVHLNPEDSSRWDSIRLSIACCVSCSHSLASGASPLCSIPRSACALWPPPLAPLLTPCVWKSLTWAFPPKRRIHRISCWKVSKRPQASRHVHRQCLPQGPEPPCL